MFANLTVASLDDVVFRQTDFSDADVKKINDEITRITQREEIVGGTRVVYDSMTAPAGSKAEAAISEFGGKFTGFTGANIVRNTSIGFGGTIEANPLAVLNGCSAMKLQEGWQKEWHMKLGDKRPFNFDKGKEGMWGTSE